MMEMASGDIKLSFKGIDWYGYPIGTLSCKPFTNESQEWSLLASAKNTLSNFLKIDNFTLQYEDGQAMLNVSPYNPIQWVAYDYTNPAKYTYKSMIHESSNKRFKNFAVQPIYLQKWQTTDEIKIHLIETGLSQLTLYIYDEKGKQDADPC